MYVLEFITTIELNSIFWKTIKEFVEFTFWKELMTTGWFDVMDHNLTCWSTHWHQSHNLFSTVKLPWWWNSVVIFWSEHWNGMWFIGSLTLDATFKHNGIHTYFMTKTTTDDFQTKPWKQMLQSHYYHSLRKRWISYQIIHKTLK